MAKKKLKIGVLFGGKSAEHEVSLRSAENIIKALNKESYLITLIKINKDGKFDFNNIKNFDVIFPVLHGPFGEDGTVQGLLKLANIPFVGASVLGSAVGMDKDVMKRLLRDAGISIGKFITLGYGEKITFEKAKKTLGLPMFIKPVNMGSSVGVSKVKNEKEFNKAIKEAFLFDTKVIIEEFIKGREIECSVLGNDKPVASIPGEVIVNDEFYSYNTKYIDENGARTEIPAKLSKKEIKNIQEVSLEAYKALSCEGFGRVDSFLKENGEVFINEINTIPGFTSISMYPKLWEASGLSLPKLLDKLIALAIERFEREQKLKTSI